MKISILMPTYECPSDLLEKSIISVALQTHFDWEIIIKDGSENHPATDDNRIRDLIGFLEESKRGKYINSPDGPPPDESGAFKHNGFYDALNRCVEASTGKILCLLCSDDERGNPDTLALVNEEFERHGPGPFCLYGACEWIDREGKYLETKVPPIVPVTFDVIMRDYPFYTPSIFWNRAVHDKFGLFDEKQWAWCADLDFWLRVWRGIDSQFTPRVIGKYRVWDTSQARSNSDLLGKEGTEILRRHRS